jgi:hypothetical protein
MTSRTLILAIALGALATIASSLATPAVAMTPDRGNGFIYDPVDSRCTTGEDYGGRRRMPCEDL